MSSLPTNIKWIGSKTTEKRWRHPFPHYKSMGAFCCHGNQSFDPISPNNICTLFPTPLTLHIKFDQDWPTGFRDIQVQKREIFVTQGQVTPKWVVRLAQNQTRPRCNACPGYPATLMMIRSNINKLALRQHFPIISLWKIYFWGSRAANSVVSGPIWPKFELARDFMHVLITCKFKNHRI